MDTDKRDVLLTVRLAVDQVGGLDDDAGKGNANERVNEVGAELGEESGVH